MRDLLGQNNMMAYLTMMSHRMIELYRVLKPTGSIYLHCDPTANHYLKLLMETMFDFDNFRNEIIWRRTYAHNDPRRFGRITDCILFYTKSESYTWNLPYVAYPEDYVERYFRHEDGGGRFQLITLTGPGASAGESGEPWRDCNPTDNNPITTATGASPAASSPSLPAPTSQTSPSPSSWTCWTTAAISTSAPARAAGSLLAKAQKSLSESGFRTMPSSSPYSRSSAIRYR